MSLQTRKVYRVIGPLGYLYSTAPYNKRSRGVFEIDPAGANNTDELFLGYLSCNYIAPKDWVQGAVYPAGAIVSGDGYTYFTETGGTAGSTRPNWSTGTQSDGGVDWSVYSEPYLIESSNSNLSDDDIVLFDDDLVIEGLRWSYLQAKKQDYVQERTDWENQVKGAYARFQGPVRVNLSDGLYVNDEFPRTPLGSWEV